MSAAGRARGDTADDFPAGVAAHDEEDDAEEEAARGGGDGEVPVDAGVVVAGGGAVGGVSEGGEVADEEVSEGVGEALVLVAAPGDLGDGGDDDVEEDEAEGDDEELLGQAPAEGLEPVALCGGGDEDADDGPGEEEEHEGELEDEHAHEDSPGDADVALGEGAEGVAREPAAGGGLAGHPGDEEGAQDGVQPADDVEEGLQLLGEGVLELEEADVPPDDEGLDDPPAGGEHGAEDHGPGLELAPAAVLKVPVVGALEVGEGKEGVPDEAQVEEEEADAHEDDDARGPLSQLGHQREHQDGDDHRHEREPVQHRRRDPQRPHVRPPVLPRDRQQVLARVPAGAHRVPGLRDVEFRRRRAVEVDLPQLVVLQPHARRRLRLGVQRIRREQQPSRLRVQQVTAQAWIAQTCNEIVTFT